MPLPISSPVVQQNYTDTVNAIRIGRFVPFLGAGVNLCKRAASFLPGETLPSGYELAEFLASQFGYPPGQAVDLARVCQYIALTKGSGELNAKLRDVFGPSFAPTKMHDLLAGIPARLERASAALPPAGRPHLRLIVTTNYDDLMETALTNAKTLYDLVWYEAEGRNKGRFYHKPDGQPARLIDKDYDQFEFDRRPVILKIHGAIDRLFTPPRRPQDSFVISEDHYLDYIARGSAGNFLPTLLTQELGDCHILFIGYGLKDWNLRAFLRQVWEDSRVSWPSWALQKNVDDLDRKLWDRRGVDLLDVDLGEYADGLEAALKCLP